MLTTIIDLLTVILGFSLIIFVHELGHFFAARWAGVRVLAFAMGFGPAVFSYRKGLGLRRGSSEPEYLARTDHTLSPTEYRLNWVPFGGYVKMLGQEDLNPGATSTAPDSYQNAKVWKRMVIISAGVVMNLLLSAVLFVVVFMIGLKTEPPVVGEVAIGTPASRAVATNAASAGVTEPGLKPGDRLLSVDGRTPRSFNDLGLAVAMAKPGSPVDVTIERSGVAQPLQFSIVPETNRLSGMLDLGIDLPRSTRLLGAELKTPEQLDQFRKVLARRSLGAVDPASELVSIDGVPVTTAADIPATFNTSTGSPVEMVFRSPAGVQTAVTITPEPKLAEDLAEVAPASVVPVEHVLGLLGVMRVSPEGSQDPRSQPKQGLKPGDIFLRIGGVEFPSIAQGIAEVRGRAGKSIDLLVLRGEKAEQVALKASVTRDGIIGFTPAQTDTLLLAMPPTTLTPVRLDAQRYTPASAGVIPRPGMVLNKINDTAVTSWKHLRQALRDATRDAAAAGNPARVTLTLQDFLRPAEATQTIRWNLSADAVRDLHALGWRGPFGTELFSPAEHTLIAAGPVDALKTGLAETHRVMTMTYLTFARLFQGSVKVDHLRGPVGIAHVGTLIAERGPVWILFFMALISVNLAVINFLPLPIVDGGQFVFLLIEQARGKPVPIGVQNAATFVGLILIGSMFLIVTYNDVVRLILG